MKEKQQFFTIGILIAICLVAFFALIQPGKADNEKIDPFDKVLNQYLEAMQTGPTKASKFAYFPNEDIRFSFEHAHGQFLDYEIESSTEINKDLREYTVLVKSDLDPDEYIRVFYFVGRINNELKFIGNVTFVPQELTHNLDSEQYSNENNPDAA